MTMTKDVDTSLFTDDEIHKFRSEIAHRAGYTGIPGYGERKEKATHDVFMESLVSDLMPEAEWRKIILGMNKGMKIVKHKNGNGKSKNYTQPITDEGNKIIFSNVVRRILVTYPHLPSDLFMDTLCKSLGYSIANWTKTKEQLIAEGYVFVNTPNGYNVHLPNLKQKQISELEAQLKKMEKDLETLKRMR